MARKKQESPFEKIMRRLEERKELSKIRKKYLKEFETQWKMAITKIKYQSSCPYGHEERVMLKVQKEINKSLNKN